MRQMRTPAPSIILLPCTTCKRKQARSGQAEGSNACYAIVLDML